MALHHLLFLYRAQRCIMHAHSQVSEGSRQASSAPDRPPHSSTQSGDFSESQPLMNGQSDSMRRSEPGAGEDPLQSSRDSSGGSNGLRDRNGGEVNVGDQEFLGQQTLDFWLNLCICHTLIVEQDKNGGLPVYQVHHLPLFLFKMKQPNRHSTRWS